MRDYLSTILSPDNPYNSHLDYYYLVGVHVELYERLGEKTLVGAFVRNVPQDAEVVVDYRVFVSTSGKSCIMTASGTALIPKILKDK